MSTGLVDQIFDYLGNDVGDSYYCKLPNGTLICWGSVNFTNASTGVQKVSKAYPHEFISSPYVVASWRDTTSTPNHMDYVYSCSDNSTPKTTCVLAAKRLATGYAWLAHYIAIGRWK